MCCGHIPSGQRVNSPDWTAIDVELRRCLSDLHFSLGHDSQDLNAIADRFATTLSALLLEFDVARIQKSSSGRHRPRKAEITVSKLS